MIDVAAGGALSALEDVSIDPQTLADGQILRYKGTSQKWENNDLPTPATPSFETLSDVDIDTSQLSGGEVSRYNATTEKWEVGAAVDPTDIINSLSSTETDKPLSAAQGKTLEDETKAIVNIYGSKNLLPNEATSTTGSVNFTVNSDGSVTATGTASADTNLTIKTFIESGGSFKDGYSEIHGKTLILSGCPESAGALGCKISFYRIDNAANSVHDTGSGVEFTYTKDTNVGASYVSIFIPNGTTLPSGGVTFSPMLRDPRIIDDTFASYAKTNKQLTNDIKIKPKFLTPTLLSTISTYNASYTATQDCWAMVTKCKSPDNYDARVSINNVVIIASGSDNASAMIPLKKGQTISTRDISTGLYYIMIFA